MNQINKAYYEIITQGDKTGQPFTFPIPTVNITEDIVTGKQIGRAHV